MKGFKTGIPGPLANGRKLHSGTRAPVSLESAGASWGSAGFGAIFALVGGFLVIGVATNSLKVSGGGGKPVLFAVGGLFFVIGLFVIAWGVASARKTSRAAKCAEENPACPARLDYFWDPEGSRIPRWNEALWACGSGGIFILFVSFFDWMVFGRANDVPIFAKIIVGLFSVIGLFVVAGIISSILRAARFAPGTLRWKSFPIPTGTTAHFVWVPGNPELSWTGGRATLRNIEEVKETSGTGKNRSSRWVHYICSEETREIPASGGFGNEVPLSFDIPSASYPTRLSGGEPAHFWELEITLEVPGINPSERHLIPVYS